MTTWILRLAKSKTIWLHMLALVALVLGSSHLSALGVDPTRIAEVQAVLGIIMRFLTTESLSAKA